MATDREAARRQRLRGAQTRDVVDADTSFGFRLPGGTSTVIATETTVEAQIATPTPAANTRRGGRQGIGGTKRSSPTVGTIDEDTMDETSATRGPQDGSTDIAEQLAKRQRRAGPAVVDDSTSRVAGRNQRLRGAQLRSPGVSTQDFGFILPVAPVAAPSVATTDTDTDMLQPADFTSTTAAPSVEAPEDTAAPPRDVTPEFQVLGEATNTSIRSSGSRSLRSSARRQRSTQDRDVEVSESPAGKPGSGRRVRISTERTENPDAAEQAARRLNDVVGTPTRPGTERRSEVVRDPSPTLTVEKPRDVRPERTEAEAEDVDMDELSPDRPKAQRSSPRRSIAEEDVSLESVRESIEGKDDDAEEATPISDTEAAAALRRNRAPKGAYTEKRPGVDDEDDEGSDQYEESADEEADAETLTAAQQRKRLAKVGRKKRRGEDMASPAVQKPAKNKTAARSEAAAASGDFMVPKKRGRPKGSKNSVKSGSGGAGRPKTKRQDMGPRSKETIAVQTYRLSSFNPPAELAAEGDDDIDEIFAQPIPIPALPRATGGVNSIDVLSQILNEVLQSALESLEQGAAQAEEAAARRQTAEKVAERREYRTKLRAVEAWGEAAGGRCLEMGLGLDAAVAMSKRVKEVERERLELRERLSEIRKERERVGVRGDGVRSRHEREGGKREVDRRLQNAIEGVSVAVGVCREAGEVEGEEEMVKKDVVMRLKQAAEIVGSKRGGDNGTDANKEGLLERLRRMNGLLERAAGALEGR